MQNLLIVYLLLGMIFDVRHIHTLIDSNHPHFSRMKCTLRLCDTKFAKFAIFANTYIYFFITLACLVRNIAKLIGWLFLQYIPRTLRLRRMLQ